MPNHYLTKKPVQLISDLSDKVTKAVPVRGIKITVFIASVKGDVLVFKPPKCPEFRLPSLTIDKSALPYHNKCILNHVFDILNLRLPNALRSNQFGDSLQCLDFAFAMPVVDGSTSVPNVAVICTVAKIPESLIEDKNACNALPWSNLVKYAEILDLNATFAREVAERAQTYCKSPPVFDDDQRKALLVRHLGACVATRELAQQTQRNSVVLVLRAVEGVQHPSLVLINVPDPRCVDLYEKGYIGLQVNGNIAEWVGIISLVSSNGPNGLPLRQSQMKDGWAVDTVFSNDGRLLVRWESDQGAGRQTDGEVPMPLSFSIVDWLSV